MVESGASVGEGSRAGEARLLTPGLAEGVSSTVAPALLPRLASCRERLRMTSDFIEIGRAEP